MPIDPSLELRDAGCRFSSPPTDTPKFRHSPTNFLLSTTSARLSGFVGKGLAAVCRTVSRNLLASIVTYLSIVGHSFSRRALDPTPSAPTPQAAGRREVDGTTNPR